MIIKYHKNFKKQFNKLIEKDRARVISAIEIFIENPNSASLHNHGLVGNLIGKRAISASTDLRIIFEEFDSYTLVILLDLGKHNQVYR